MDKTYIFHSIQQIKRPVVHYFYIYGHRITIAQKLIKVYRKEGEKKGSSNKDYFGICGASGSDMHNRHILYASCQ